MTHKKKPDSLFPKILIIAGVAVVIGVIFIIRNQPAAATTPVNESPETLLDRSIDEGKPVFAFFHSNNCHSCIVMMNTVAEVYPEFSREIVLVDVDVYDPQNENLLRRGNIRTIPTQIFIDREATGKITFGAMEADILRQHLQSLLETP
jgi:thiol:disulfide interchange protein